MKTINHGKYHWSRIPGKFVNKTTGGPSLVEGKGHTYKGTTLQWYECLVHTIIDAKMMLEKASGIKAQVAITSSKDLMCILECTPMYTAHDEKEYCGKLYNELQVEYVANKKQPKNTFEVTAYDESTKTKHTMLVEVLDVP